MKTTYDQDTILYQLLDASTCPLRQAITGSIYKEQRPESELEDVVINPLTITSDPIQLGASNVNIYVPDIRVNNGYVANDKRLNELTQLALDTLEEVYHDDYTLWVKSQSVEDEPDSKPKHHYSNLRIEFRHFNF